MRVLHAIQEMAAGGAERVVLTLVEGARRAGHEAAVAAAPGPLVEEHDGTLFELPLVERRAWRLPSAALALHQALRTFRPEVLHLHNPAMAVIGALATARGRRLTGLVTVHGVPDDDYPGAARLLRLSGWPVVACGPGVAAALEKRDLRATATIVNGIGPPPKPTSRSNLRDIDIPDDRPLVVSVGRLVPQKNHVLAIRALSAVPEAVLVIVGTGPLRGALGQEARARGVDDRVVFVGARPDARQLMAAADAVVLTSRWEGLPLVALEALAAGTPLVATCVPGLRELLHDEVDTLLVPDGDAHGVGVALRRVLGDNALREHLRANGRKMAATYSEEAMVTAYLDLYQALVRRPKS